MPRVAAVNGLSITQLEQMLQSRRTELQGLQRQRHKIARKLDQMELRIRQLGGSARGRGAGGRVRNQQSLNDMIEHVLKGSGKPMGVGDIADSVLSKGYRTKSANFRGIVNQMLIKDKRFASADRGVYQLKK